VAKHRDTRAFYANNLESYIVIVLQLSKDRIIFMVKFPPRTFKLSLRFI